MKRGIFLCIFLFSVILSVFSQSYTVSGKVLEEKRHTPVEYALVSIPEKEITVMTNDKGNFTIRNLPAGSAEIVISSLGYQKVTFHLSIGKDRDDLVFYLSESSLALQEVQVTAQRKTEDLATSYTIGRAALEQMQVLNVTEIAALLPGGQTSRRSNLAVSRSSTDHFAIRTNGSGEMGLPEFGTVIEVDGVRLSDNSLFPDRTAELERTSSTLRITGADTRNIGTSNIESIEITTGVPSVEHGDLSNGLIRIHTRKGKSPWQINAVTKPNTKSFSLSKGFDLGNNRGVLNAAFERTKSNSDLASPYTAYDRNNLSLTYSNTWNTRKTPLRMTFGLSGNLGGFDSKADPDAFTDTYSKERDHTIRGSLDLDWLLNKPWITNLQFLSTLNYSDQLSEVKKNQSSSSATAAIHARKAGYFIATDYDTDPDAEIILIPAGYWYTTGRDDNKPLTYTSKLKANQAGKIGRLNHRLMLGIDYSRSSNEGRGLYYTDMRYAPTYRDYRYDEQPAVHNWAVYAEETLALPLSGGRKFDFSIGLRGDMTYISGSEYGTVSSLSPRLNAKYLFWKRPESLLSEMGLRASFGDAVKLPSAYILNPIPTYTDRLSFTPGTMADGSVYYAYNTMPSTNIYNPDLKWQRSRLLELEWNGKAGQVTFSLLAYHSRTMDPYIQRTLYIPYTYKQTDQSALNNFPIPSMNRVYSIDRETGIVTVSDKTGANPDQQLVYKEKLTAKSNSYYANGSAFSKKGLEWIVDFGQIPSIRTSFRVDGSYNHYKGIEKELQANLLTSQYMADGNLYKYIGFYEGGNSVSNGSLSKKLTNNLSVTTHIPAIRMILSLRLESNLLNYARNLSESSFGTRGFPIDNVESYFPSETATDIYAGDHYVAVYPQYYISLDDMETKIPFAEKFAWAKENDPALFNELAKLVLKTNRNYYFKSQNVSAYYSANLSVTKELGEYVSISFLANNFLNNMSKVKYSQSGNEATLYDNSLIPTFYYGLTLRIKL
ncbi:carboxypeptidase-like regulatory domain-containing protein [Parabacteroides sp. Marseille-P3160]|uniref:carboxypeptidase-like regulatory domain-containing protein n=1 Tax=Parabacteroides sp. Marseille-P3160 TaxID=1917887 RepID=UPI0009B9AF27|nr:carboxypeptidase-like regulatory domain-containing protein [Parabacteroides sp. Marseille-P3160]